MFSDTWVSYWCSEETVRSTGRKLLLDCRTDTYPQIELLIPSDSQALGWLGVGMGCLISEPFIADDLISHYQESGSLYIGTYDFVIYEVWDKIKRVKNLKKPKKKAPKPFVLESDL